MPARTPRQSLRSRPHRLARLGRLPQHEIGGGVLVVGHLDARARDHVVQRALGQPAVTPLAPVPRRDAEQNLAVRDIGHIARDQILDHRDHLAHMRGGARLEGRRQRVQRRHVGVVDVGVALGDDGNIDAFVHRLPVDLVVDIGDVARIDDMVLAIHGAQQPEQHVEHHDRPRIADMGVIIDGRAADIEGHALRIARNERDFFAAQGVVNRKTHRFRWRNRL